jgi:hypothetical protein
LTVAFLDKFVHFFFQTYLSQVYVHYVAVVSPFAMPQSQVIKAKWLFVVGWSVGGRFIFVEDVVVGCVCR